MLAIHEQISTDTEQPAEELPLSMIVSAANESMIRAYLMALVGGRDAVDDLSQEVFLRAIERIDTIATHSDPPRFLRGIARRVAHEWFRRKRRSRFFVDSTLNGIATEDPCISEALSRAEEVARLREAMASLPIVARRMLELRYHDGLSASDIGETLGMSAGAVRVTLLRIRDRLHRHIDLRRTLAA